MRHKSFGEVRQSVGLNHGQVAPSDGRGRSPAARSSRGAAPPSSPRDVGGRLKRGDRDRRRHSAKLCPAPSRAKRRAETTATNEQERQTDRRSVHVMARLLFRRILLILASAGKVPKNKPSSISTREKKEEEGNTMRSLRVGTHGIELKERLCFLF